MNQQLDLFAAPVAPKLAAPAHPPFTFDARPLPGVAYDEGYEEGGWLHLGMRSIGMLWPLPKLREKVAFFTDAEGLAGGVQKMRGQKLADHLIERRIANVARLASIMKEVLAEREADG